MLETEESRAPFELCGGHPALDFANSLDERFRKEGPVELLTEYRDLLRFTEQTGLLDSRQARLLAKSADSVTAARVLRSARELREALAATLYGSLNGRPPRAADIETLERHFRAASEHRELRRHSSAGSAEAPRLEWEWGRFATRAELPLWLLSQSASELMLSKVSDRVRACGAETCQWLFLDTSKNHTRRWCNMKVCGNRMKARRYQARHA